MKLGFPCVNLTRCQILIDFFPTSSPKGGRLLLGLALVISGEGPNQRCHVLERKLICQRLRSKTREVAC